MSRLTATRQRTRADHPRRMGTGVGRRLAFPSVPSADGGPTPMPCSSPEAGIGAGGAAVRWNSRLPHRIGWRGPCVIRRASGWASLIRMFRRRPCSSGCASNRNWRAASPLPHTSSAMAQTLASRVRRVPSSGNRDDHPRGPWPSPRPCGAAPGWRGNGPRGPTTRATIPAPPPTSVGAGRMRGCQTLGHRIGGGGHCGSPALSCVGRDPGSGGTGIKQGVGAPPLARGHASPYALDTSEGRRPSRRVPSSRIGRTRAGAGRRAGPGELEIG